MILSTDTQRDIRNAALSALHYIAFDQHCEVEDILALLISTPSQPFPPQATVASPATTQEQAEEVAPTSSATPIQQSRPAEIRQGRGGAAARDEAAHTGKTAGSQGPAAPLTIVQRVREAIEQHPDWTARQIEEATGIEQTKVNKAARSLGISPRRLTTEEREEAYRAAGIKGAQTKAGALVQTDGSEGLAPPLPKAKIPKGTRYRLRQHAGRGKYLHMGGAGLVDSRSYAWIGSAEQLEALRAKFPGAIEMVAEEVVQP